MMPAPMSQIGASTHPAMQGPPPQQQPTQSVGTEYKYDNIAKAKHLIWSLKDVVANVMKVAGNNVYQVAAGKAVDETTPRIDKTLEDFYSICNQIELNLKAIQECTLQQKDSIQYLPLHVSPGKIDTPGGPSQDGNLSYGQYLITIKGQVNFAKAVQEMLNEGARKISQVD